MRSRLAWFLFALTVPCAVGQTVLLASSRPLLSVVSFLEGWPFVTASAVLGAFVGALVVSRHPAHPVGWLLCIGQSGTALGLLAAAYGLRAVTLDPAPEVDAGHVAVWVGALLGGAPALALMAALFLLAPDGRLLSRRWRAAVVTCFTGLGLHVVAIATISPADLTATAQPIRSEPLTRLLALLAPLLILAALVAGAVSLTLRLRHAEGDRRRQLLWVAAPAAGLAVGLLVLLVPQVVWRLHPDLPVPGQGVGLLLSMPLFLAFASLPVCAGIAVLRHRLFDIDVVVSRAVVLTVATVFVAVAYVVVVVTLGQAFGGSGGHFWQSLTATAVAALAFQPLRLRIVRLADRLAYGPRAVPYEALAAFSARLTRSPTPQELLSAAAAAAGTAVSAQQVTATLDLSGAEALEGRWPSQRPMQRQEPAADVVIDVQEGGETLGRFAVGMPPGRAVRPVEHRLLADLADQAALAFRNAKLEAELVAHVATLDRHTEELAASRRRIIDARDVERIRLERAISQDVLPYLAPLPGQLEQAATALRVDAAPPDLEALSRRVTDALEALRRLSHGVFPTQLSRSGLGPALRSLLARAQPAASLACDEEVEQRRFPAATEAAVYFCCSVAVRASMRELSIHLAHPPGALVLEIRPLPPGTAVQEMVDRVEALGGSLTVLGDRTAERNGSAGQENGNEPRLRIRVPVPA